MIDPNEISTIRVGQLPTGTFALSNKIAHEIGSDLNQGSIEDLSIFIASYIGASEGVGFRAISVTDGQTLPTTTNQEFILVGKGTFYNVNGGATIVCTEELNAIVSNGNFWFIGVEIPVNVELAGIVQTIREGFTTTTPSEDAVFKALALKGDIGTFEETANKISTITGYSEILYPNEKAVHDGLDAKLNISDLPSNLTLYATNVPSGISTYTKWVTTINDPDYNTTAVDISTGAITGTAQLLSGLSSIGGVIVGNPGEINVTTVGEIRRTAGTGTAKFYFELYKRSDAGVEEFLGVSNFTAPVDFETYAEFSATSILNNGVFLETDRLVIKFYGSRIAGGGNPTFDFQFGGLTPVRTIVPVPFRVLAGEYELKANKVSTLSASDVLYPNNNAVIAGLSTKADLVGGLVPQNQLPSFVDDVLEFANLASFPATGEIGKIYIAIDSGKQYRWSGSAYIQITNGLIASTNDVPEGSNNLYFLASRVLSSILTGLSTASSSVITAADTVLSAFGKLQVQILLKQNIISGTANVIPKFGTGGLVGSNLSDNGTLVSTSTDMTINGVRVGRGGGFLSNNTTVGAQAGNSNNNGNQNTFIGASSGFSNTSGSNNAFNGFSSGFSNTSGSNNLYEGRDAARNNSLGSNNVALGFQAGRYTATKVNNAINLENSILVGFNTSPLGNSQTNQIVIGYDATGLGSNTTVLGNSSTVSTAIYGDLLLGGTVDNGVDKLQVTGTISATAATTSNQVVVKSQLDLKENLSNKQNSLATDGTGIKYPTVDAINNNVFESNKKWVLFGDSISNTLVDPDYPFYVIQNLKLTGTVTNAVAGNTSADQLSVLNSILTTTPTYFNNFDIASLLIGVNDWATNVDLGNRQSLSSENNYAGRIKAIIEKILIAKPNIRFYIMTPFETNSISFPYNSFNTKGYTLREMSALISQICSDYSVQCIDLYSLSQINLKTVSTLLEDGVHPNPTGAKFIGDIVSKAFLNNNNNGKLIDTGIRRKRDNLYEEIENNIFKIQKGSFQPTSLYDVGYNIGIGKSIPKIKLEILSKYVDTTPVLGSETTGALSILSNDGLYGMYFGVSNTGDVWQQVQRNDGINTTYNLQLQPLSGNVLIGTNSDNGSKLQVTGAATFSSSVTAASAKINNLANTNSRAIVADASGNLSASGLVPLKSYTVSTLPTGQQQGTTAYVTDATAPTYLGALIGGGTVKCPVFYNGTIWVSH